MWFHKLIEAFGGEGNDQAQVKRLLERAQHERVRVELIDSGGSPNNPLRLSTTIEQVRDNDIVVSRPTLGGRLRPLATGGELSLVIGLDGQRLAALTRTQGRIRVKSGSGGMFYGYRLAMPESFKPEERRAAPRYEVRGDDAPDAELAVLGLNSRVHGLVIDLSATGMSMRSPNARGRVKEGQRAYLTVKLPEPVGVLKETVNVVRIQEHESGAIELGLGFLRQIPEVNEMLKHFGGPHMYREAS